MIKMMLTKRFAGISIVFLLLFPIFSASAVFAGECSYGSMYAWFRRDNEEWRNATAHPYLKLGEEFEVKVVVTAKTGLSVIFFKLREFGTPVFEVLDGPTVMDELLVCGRSVKTGENFTYIWRVRVNPDTKWFNAYSPLEVFAQFNKNDHDSCTVYFDVLTAYVLDEFWEGYNATCNYNNTNITSGKKVTPGFEILLFLVAVFFMVFLVRRRLFSI
jgi:sarcinarray family protein